MDWSDMGPPGAAVTLAQGLVRVLAPNPSALTGPGTNSYLVGERVLAVIDPGPDDPAHLDALQAAIGGRPVSHVIVTHGHRDHSALAPALAQATGAPVLAFGPATAGRSAVMAALDLPDSGEGADPTLAPDVLIGEGDRATGPGWTLHVVHTPGHMGGHLALVWGDAVFCGDTVMGWSSSLVSPPDGDMGDYMASLARLAALSPRILYPGHGAPVTDPAVRIAALAQHRGAREAAILAALAHSPATIAALTARIYADTAPALWPAAARNVLAHLIDLTTRNRVVAQPTLSPEATFHAV